MMNYLEHRFLSATAAEVVGERKARLGREGSSTRRTDIKLVVTNGSVFIFAAGRQG